MPFLLMVFLTLACLPDLVDWPKPLWATTPGVSALLSLGCVALPIVYLASTSCWMASRLRRDPLQRDRWIAFFERTRARHQFFLCAAFLISLCLLGWGWSVTQLWHGPAGVLPGAEVLLLAPYLAGLLLTWLVSYDADRAAYLAAHALLQHDPLARAMGEPIREAPGFGSRWAYVLFQVRQKLALVFIPVGLLLALKEVQRLLPESWQKWQATANLIAIGLILVVFLAMPWIIRLVLGLKPLPNGPLRNRLLTTARRLRFRCSDILLWNTNHGMANAMVVGVLPWLRYVVFTDRLLQEFTPSEVEAVLGHEVGHVKHHHMLYYMLFLLGSMTALGTLATDYLPALLREAAEQVVGGEWSRVLAGHRLLQVVLLVGLLVAYILIVFGFLSRRCERQADIFGCRAVSCERGNCIADECSPRAASPSQALCHTGIRTFISALEKVAYVNGISRERPGFLQSWQHSTIAKRVEFLELLLNDPALEPRFQRNVTLVKWGLFAVLGGVLLAIGLFQGWAS